MVAVHGSPCAPTPFILLLILDHAALTKRSTEAITCNHKKREAILKQCKSYTHVP